MKQIIKKQFRGNQGGKWYVLECNQCHKEFKKDHSDVSHHPFKFCSHSCSAKYRISQGWKKKGKESYNWKGGKTIDGHGYIRVYQPKHPNNYSGYVLEHRLVMEKHLKRFLKTDEVVHHKNHNKKDNRIENLVILNKSSHSKQHHIDDTFNTTRDPVTGRFINK